MNPIIFVMQNTYSSKNTDFNYFLDGTVYTVLENCSGIKIYSKKKDFKEKVVLLQCLIFLLLLSLVIINKHTSRSFLVNQIAPHCLDFH